ncbi:MAG: DUF1501 domain-containing protein [Phormidesmis sp.]
MKRRQFIQNLALAAGASSSLSACVQGWTWQNRAVAQSAAAKNALSGDVPRLIVIFLRGAADGLNIVVPYQEPNYYALRPTLAIAKPGEENGAIDLDGQFGLHPALRSLMPEWQKGNLAFVHAAGSPIVERSHFQAQDYMETATPGETNTTDGWLNRLLSVLPEGSSTQAVNIGRTSPLIFTGSEPVASLAVSGAVSRPLPIDRPQVQTAFDRLYSGNSALAQTYKEGRAARETLVQEFNAENEAASRGAPSPGQFLTSARYVARLMSGDAATQIAFMELGNWDTHVNERFILQRHLEFLGNGLATLVEELGPVYEQTTIVVMSEFGRTVAENGSAGTDHGFGNAMWLLGGGIKGGKVYGEWPGLETAELHQDRELAVTTDFRDVLISLLSQQFSLSDRQLAQVFPRYQARTKLGFV